MSDWMKCGSQRQALERLSEGHNVQYRIDKSGWHTFSKDMEFPAGNVEFQFERWTEENSKEWIECGLGEAMERLVEGSRVEYCKRGESLGWLPMGDGPWKVYKGHPEYFCFRYLKESPMPEKCKSCKLLSENEDDHCDIEKHCSKVYVCKYSPSILQNLKEDRYEPILEWEEVEVPVELGCEEGDPDTLYIQTPIKKWRNLQSCIDEVWLLSLVYKHPNRGIYYSRVIGLSYEESGFHAYPTHNKFPIMFPHAAIIRRKVVNDESS